MIIFPIDKQKTYYRQLARINTDSIISSLYLEYPSRQAMREYERNYVSPFFELHIFIVLFMRLAGLCSCAVFLHALYCNSATTAEIIKSLGYFPWYIQVHFALLLISIISHSFFICFSDL